MKTTAAWLVSVGSKFFRIAPVYTAISISATLLSQVSLLLAYFLPLKVIILISSNRVPHYFPDELKAVGHSNLVMALSVATLLFYALNIISEKIVAKSSDAGARRLISRSNKILLFNNQDEIATQAYQRYSRSVAALLFVVAAIFIMLMVDHRLFLILVGFFGFVFLLLSLGYQRYFDSERVSAPAVAKIANSISAGGFFITFSYIVVGFLIHGSSNALVAVISLLVVRQSFQRVSSLIVDIHFLGLQRPQINALFFHGHTFQGAVDSKELSFWHLLNQPQRNQWVSNILREVVGRTVVLGQTQWHQLATSDVGALEVVLADSAEKTGGYLIKLFNANRRDLAIQEATVLAECADLQLPALEFLGASHVDGLHCLVFRMGAEKKVSLKELKAKVLETSALLLAVEPPAALVSRYARSRPLVWQRLELSMTARLKVAAKDATECENIEKFEQQLSGILAAIQKLPLQFLNPDITAESVLIGQDGQPVLSQWGRWTLEPLGAAWPINPNELPLLAENLKKARSTRACLAHVSEAVVVLSALMFAYERALGRQQIATAVELLPQILAVNGTVQSPPT
ncbi:hypothetical protein HNP46_003981 [Pseudomonas nitritireducens]|uniref:Uncharacterized protein n=1 Tax=Pseudomonas nitroreducens TaxID=46680 RepID=A0A7W7KLQ3_PSENT|nr:hypothetical protein [Pseudomonas nitritireducens]MBB4865105.1 hypothetical protein [Pseudomonas nitritireducens]